MITAINILNQRLRGLQQQEENREQALKENESASSILREELTSIREDMAELIKGIQKLNESD